MPSIKDFIHALEAGWFTASISLIGCCIVIFGDYYAVPYLSSTPVWFLNLAVIVGVFSFAIIMANFLYFPIFIFKAVRKRFAKAKAVRRAYQEVEAATPDEKEVLRYLIATGQRAFVANYGNSRLITLVAKGLIQVAPGQHSIMEFPHVVQPYVWAYLEKNRDEIVGDQQDIVNPFDRRFGR